MAFASRVIVAVVGLALGAYALRQMDQVEGAYRPTDAEASGDVRGARGDFLRGIVGPGGCWVVFVVGAALVVVAAWPRRQGRDRRRLRPAARVALALLGLAVTAYGVASLTGGWMGKPPWQKSVSEYEGTDVPPRVVIFSARPNLRRDWVGGALTVVGIATIAAAARRPEMRRSLRGASERAMRSVDS